MTLFLRFALAAWSSPGPSSPFSFVLPPSLLPMMAFFFLSVCCPFNDSSFDCREGEGTGGEAWLLGRTGACGKPKVKHIPFSSP